jgi:hypothetical protein
LLCSTRFGKVSIARQIAIFQVVTQYLPSNLSVDTSLSTKNSRATHEFSVIRLVNFSGLMSNATDDIFFWLNVKFYHVR